MMDEQLEEQAAAYVLGALEPNESDAFDARLARDAELNDLVDDLRTAAAQMAHGAPPRMPPDRRSRDARTSIRSDARRNMP